LKNPSYGYYHDKKMRGMVSGFIYDQEPQVARIRYLYVHRNYRKKFGVGRQLLNNFTDVLKIQGVKRVRAEMALREYDSKEFYEKCGFVHVGMTSNFLEKTL
jgi:N-acetylglutamate synthase-like GNAT family acetyltransferase